MWVVENRILRRGWRVCQCARSGVVINAIRERLQERKKSLSKASRTNSMVGSAAPQLVSEWLHVAGGAG